MYFNLGNTVPHKIFFILFSVIKANHLSHSENIITFLSILYFWDSLGKIDETPNIFPFHLKK